ncbi:hypothetical protein ACIBKY_00100 [Nonomuraea sp. NPDC050394]|uniref:hypothetical protein n=1 Tax=Nonomuraea sp. NPDC050394 TaxID=3364363 RepID=UPI003793F2FB
MMRNAEPRETELEHLLYAVLRSMLPEEWVLKITREPRWASEVGVDATFEIQTPDGALSHVHVETKRRIEPRDVDRLLSKISAYDKRYPSAETTDRRAQLIAASYVSPRVRELLAAQGAGWFDPTGNLRLQLREPLIFIDRRGADRNPYPAQDRRLRSLRGPGAARIVRALLDGRGFRGVRDLAAEAQVSAATSSRVLELLNRDSLLERDNGGAVVTVRKRSLVHRWVQDYGVTTSNHAVPMLSPRGAEQVFQSLPDYPGRYALTLSAALHAYLPAGRTAVTPLTLPALFVDDVMAAQRDLKLHLAPRGANVLLIEPFDEVVYRNPTVRAGLRYVSPAQAAADLLTGAGRSPEEGAQLLELLAESDREWAA